MKNNLLTLALLTTASAVLHGCGGGGGDGSDESFSGAASVSIRVTPSDIDTGDRTQVELSVGDVNEVGVALKLRYPSGLRYVSGSATLTVESVEKKINPSVNISSQEAKISYLVFYVPQKSFRRPGEPYSGDPGTVTLQLAGKAQVQDGLVEVDADIDDPAKDNSEEFKITSPEFLADDQAPISVQSAQ